jgi:hypothetical protein
MDQLRQMGYNNEPQMMLVLKQNNGNVVLAVDRLYGNNF